MDEKGPLIQQFQVEFFYRLLQDGFPLKKLTQAILFHRFLGDTGRLRRVFIDVDHDECRASQMGSERVRKLSEYRRFAEPVQSRTWGYADVDCIVGALAN
jgi:hypothetical protein